MVSKKIVSGLLLLLTFLPQTKAMQQKKDPIIQRIERVCTNYIPLPERKNEIENFKALCMSNKNDLNDYIESTGYPVYRGTVLHLLIRKNSCINPGLREPMMACLLKHGANPTATDENGNNVLHLAALEGWLAVAELLEKTPHCKVFIKQLVNAVNKEGKTPLHLASTEGMADWLIKQGAIVNFQDQQRETPLHKAAHDNKPYVIQRLIQAGASLEAANKNGKTPLVAAVTALTNNATSVALLLINGANPAIPNLKEEYKNLFTAHITAQKPLFASFRESLIHYDDVCAQSEKTVNHSYGFAKKTRLILQGIGALTAGAWSFFRLQSVFKGNQQSAKIVGVTLFAALIGGLIPRILPCKRFVDWTVGKRRYNKDSDALGALNTDFSLLVNKEDNLSQLSSWLTLLPHCITPLQTQKARNALTNMRQQLTATR